MIGLTAVATSTASASGRAAKHPGQLTASTVSSRCEGSYKFRCGPIYNAYDYLGDDPDPFIRAMIQRDLGAKYGGSQ